MELNLCENKMDEKCTEKYIDFKVTTSINNFLVNHNFQKLTKFQKRKLHCVDIRESFDLHLCLILGLTVKMTFFGIFGFLFIETLS